MNCLLLPNFKTRINSKSFVIYVIEINESNLGSKSWSKETAKKTILYHEYSLWE